MCLAAEAVAGAVDLARFSAVVKVVVLLFRFNPLAKSYRAFSGDGRGSVAPGNQQKSLINLFSSCIPFSRDSSPFKTFSIDRTACSYTISSASLVTPCHALDELRYLQDHRGQNC